MAPVHKASLVEASNHSKEVLQLLGLDIDRILIDHLVQETAEAVDQALSRPIISHDRSNQRSQQRIDFADFIANVLCAAVVKIPTLLVTLVYIHRSKAHLSIETEQWALHRVFLGALILASKYTNDSTLRNSHWAIATGLFGKRDIGRIEREFLEVLDWQLSVSESNILDLHEPLMALYPLRCFARPPRRLISSVKTVFSWPDSDSEGSSPASSPTPSTPSTSSPPRDPSLNKSKPIKDAAIRISHTFSFSHTSHSGQRLISPSYPHLVTA